MPTDFNQLNTSNSIAACMSVCKALGKLAFWLALAISSQVCHAGVH